MASLSDDNWNFSSPLISSRVRREWKTRERCCVIRSIWFQIAADICIRVKSVLHLRIFSSVASSDIYHWRIRHCYLFKWPSRVRSQIFQHHPPLRHDPLFLCTFHSPSYFASTGNEKRPILASFISWIYARLLFNKRFSLATAPDRSTSDSCRKWQFSYCRRHDYGRS